MQVILRQNVSKLGTIGEIVSVKMGYGRNYLIPRQLAYVASPGAIKALETEKKQYAVKMDKVKANAEVVAGQLADLQVSIPMQVGEEGRLFGSVTSQMIGQELDLRGFSVAKRNIIIEEPIKTLGVFEIKVKLHQDISAPLKVWVIAEE